MCTLVAKQGHYVTSIIPTTLTLTLTQTLTLTLGHDHGRGTWKNSPDVSVYHDSVSPRLTQSSLLLYINKMMCERRDQTQFSDATQSAQIAKRAIRLVSARYMPS